MKTRKYILPLLMMTMLLGFALQIRTAKAAEMPTNIKQAGAYTNGAVVTWDEVKGNKISYKLQYSLDKINWISSTDVNTNIKIFDEFLPGSTYYVRVASVEIKADDNYTTIQSEYTNPIEVITAPDANEISTVEQTAATPTAISVKWHPASGSSIYNIYDLATDKLLGQTTTPEYTFSNLTVGQTLSIKIAPIRIGTNYTAGYPQLISNYKTKTGLKATQTAILSTYFGIRDEYKLKVSFKAIDNTGTADGFEFRVYNVKTKKVVYTSDTKNSESGYFKFKKGITYKYRVRTYSLVDGVKYYSDWSDYRYMAGSVIKARINKKGQMTINWQKVPYAKKYKVYISTSKNGTYKHVKSLNKNKLTIKKYKHKKFSKNKTYYIKVVPSLKINKKNVVNDFTPIVRYNKKTIIGTTMVDKFRFK